MAAVVHHGGAGTTASGFRAGVPTVIVPHNADQPFWGRHAKALGVGTDPIPRKKLTADKLAVAIHAVTSNPEIAQNARRLGEKIRQDDGLSDAVKLAERYLTQVATG
jgi:sterol 3beta-glucosyltransferase